MLCCNYCKKVQDETEIDKYRRLFVEPLWFSLKKDEHALSRAMGSYFLENTAKLFATSDNEENEMRRIIAATQKAAASGNNTCLIDCLAQVSPGAYLRQVARCHFNKLYDIAFATALCYLSAKASICYMAFRTQFICKDDNRVFFDIGVSLDEGCVEYFTQELTKAYGGKYIADAYYFEVEFYKNIIKQFNIERQDEGKIMFANGGPALLYEHTKNVDKCSFYNLFQLSDDQNWRGAYQILKDIKESKNYGVDL